jgi:site-specific recombinase XerD
MRQLAAFCHEENIHPLQATTQSIVRYTAWLGLQGTVAATSLQQYYSAINKFFRDHQQ